MNAEGSTIILCKMKKTRVERICEWCGSTFEVQLWRFRRNPNEGRFCKIICHNKSRKGLPAWNKGIPIRPEVRQKLLDRYREKPNPLKGRPLSAEHRKNMSLATIGKKRDESFRESARRATLKRYAEGGFSGKQETMPEVILDSLLHQTHATYERQYRLASRFLSDFAIPSRMLLLQADGDYWHANPKMYSQDQLTVPQKRNRVRDSAFNTWATRMGWHVLRFWEDDLINRPKDCLKLLQATISFLPEVTKLDDDPCGTVVDIGG